MKKKIFSLIMCGVLLVCIAGCGNNSINDSKKNDSSVNDKEINKEDKKNYTLMQEIILKDNSKWVMLEDKEDKVLLFSTKGWGKCDKSEEQEKLKEIKEKLEKSLSKNGGNANNLNVRIPTTDDFIKYFNIDFNNYADQYHNRVNGPKVSNSLYELVGSIRLFRIDNKLNNEWSGSNVLGKFEAEKKIFWFSNILVDKNVELVPIIEISKSNIKN